MIKIILGVFITVLVLVSTIVVLYWRDINYDPDTQDMLIFFGLVPFAISLLLLMPFFIKQWYQENKIKKQKELERQNNQQDEQTIEEKPEEIRWLNLNVFSAHSYSALGEDQAIWEGLKNFQSPELDQKLQNGYGLPILSYRIADLDDLITDIDSDEWDNQSGLSQRQARISALMKYQLQQHAETLWLISQHLKNSALFYDTQLAHEYRMHPAWIDPNAQVDDSYDQPRTVHQVSKLNRLNVHLILAEDQLHTSDESLALEKLTEFFNEMGILPQMFHVEFHYWGKETAYKQWFDLLEHIQKMDHQISLVIAVDSEIDQDTVDEKTWMSDQYIPAEFVGSCIVANTTLQVDQLSPQKTIKIALNDHQLFNTLEQLNSKELPQYQNEDPFVIQLDDPADIKVIKRLEKNFEQTNIEQHHYLFIKQSVGQTEHLAKIFGFMIAMHAPDEVLSLVYSCDQPRTQCVIQPFSEPETVLEQASA
ncbi:hypothetical protein G9F32_14130 [Acinetobacter sp. 194]|uniref:hypothetical protein n=1 Tax=Acinetobacter shaoyimingii TaxID=2715164 RepID=UPI00140ADD4D|nr:hypothetical protein [Acinetobacter shaoyimingii]NHB59143.1 hypothetical protein [Acinetobacter shaoyimingii]